VLTFINNWAAFSPDRRRVAISGQDEKIRVYDFEQEPRKITLPGGAENLTSYSVALSNDGRWLANGSGGEIHVLDLESNTIAATLKGHVHGVFSLSFSPDDRTLGSSSGTRVIFWHVETWQELMRFQDNVPPRTAFLPRLDFSPHSRYLVRTGTPVGETGTRFRIWQAPSLEEIAEKHKR
jgi:WD40 repeat protein